SYFFFLHAKALFLLPFIFFLGLKWELKKALKLIVCLFTLWCGYESFAYYLAKSSCTENPALAAWVSGHMVSPREFISEPAKTSLGLLTNLLNFRSYFYGILFSKHQGWWLRDATGWSGWVRFVNAGIKYWLYFWMGLLTIEALKFIKGRRNLDGLLVAGLLVGVIGLSAMMRLKTPYEANFIFPLLIIITAITLRETSSTSLGWQWSQRGFLLLALVSLFLNLRFFQPYIETDLQTSGRLARLTNGYSAFNIQTPHDQIRQLANQCNLTKDTVKKNLIIDTFTYTFFWEIPQPIFGDFYFLTATTGNIPPISHGLLMQCQFLPGTVKNKAVRLGDFCCIPSKNQEDSNN
ncbi:hypothetical protein EBQ90_12190, partial [bacterium]|nr:hypothetical protein [bacterium]